MAYPTLEEDRWSNTIELTSTSKDAVEQKPQSGFEGLEDVEDTTLDNNGSDNTSDNARLLEKTNSHVELPPLAIEQVRKLTKVQKNLLASYSEWTDFN